MSSEDTDQMPDSETIDLHPLLIKSSRTFALSIPLLPDPTRQEVTVAYLLFRIADTFEDAALWDRTQRQKALRDFVLELDQAMTAAPGKTDTTIHSRHWTHASPVEHAGYLELLSEIPAVLGAFAALQPTAREAIHRHTVRTTEGMAEFVARGTEAGELHLQSIQDLRDYCYVVAGIVGEMLTELFVIGQPPLREFAPELEARAAAFGEGLQLVNILKDAAADRTEGRSYLPADVARSEVFAIAREDLERAAEYTLLLQEAASHRGLVAFNALPVLLARATLDRVEEKGAGAKLTRPEVFSIVTAMNADLDAGRPVVTAR